MFVASGGGRLRVLLTPPDSDTGQGALLLDTGRSRGHLPQMSDENDCHPYRRS